MNRAKPVLIACIGAAAATVAAAGGACGTTGIGQTATIGPDGQPVVASNVLFEDYAGSRACEPCHASIARRFDDSPMHRMTRAADRTEVLAPFDGGRLRVGDDVATMTSAGERRYLHLRSKKRGRRLYRITHVIGGRYREDYVGVRVAGTGARDRLLADPPTRLILPVSWMIEDASWRYKGYSVQVKERPGMKAGPEWNRTCIFCHNTVPYLSLVFDDLGDFDVGYQGAITSNLLPAARRLRFDVRDERGLSRALVDEIERLGERAPGRQPFRSLLQRAVHATKDRFRGEHLVELGIGCESCHGGARRHAEDPAILPSHRPRSPLFTVEAEQGKLGRAGAINHSCARCHAVLFSRYPYTWEGGTRQQHPRGSTINSGEARNFLLGGCAREMSCASCHDPHGEDDPAELARLGTPAGNPTCTRCHDSLASEQALRRHSHHDPRGAGGSCVACHMPRKNAGLDYELTRYHRIGSPTDRRRVEQDRPLECALCHLDGTVEQLVTSMEQWWGKRYDRAELRQLYGDDLSVSVLEATLARGLPHEQTVAIDRLGHTRDARYLRPLVEQLDHEYPLVRYYVRESLRRLSGAPVPLDMSRPGTEIRAAGQGWLREQTPR